MKKLFLSWWYKVPLKINDVWYNRSAYISDQKFPEIFDENKSYIFIDKDRLYAMEELPNGKRAYYKISGSRYRNGDWLSDSDGWQVDFTLNCIK